MRGSSQQTAAAWELAARQHWVITRRQLLDLGFSAKAIERRIRGRRLYVVWRGVYAVGRPQLTRHGEFMAAVLACGPGAVLSHVSAAELWEIVPPQPGPVHVSTPDGRAHRFRGISVHRRSTLASADLTAREGIPVTTPIRTLFDIAPGLARDRLEAAINQADKRELVDPESLREAVASAPGCSGARALRTILDHRTFTLTDSELERRFLPIVRRAGLPKPQTQVWLSGFRVDFYWPELGLVVETDGLRYHRTPAQQARDRERDQALTAQGLTVLRFTHAQVRFEPSRVATVLASVAARLLT